MFFSKIQISSICLLLLACFISAQQTVYGQCGGIGWSGSTSCTSGNTCVSINPYYSQCLPGSAATTTSTSSPVTVRTSSTRSSLTTGATTTTSVSAGQTSDAMLPDPFTFLNGSRVSSKAQWSGRRDEINQLYQLDKAGTFPGKPSSVTATFASNTLTITCSVGGNTISFTASITYPSSGQAPYPAIIGYGGGSITQPAGVAMINYNNLDLAADSTTRGSGKFYTLYGATASGGAEVGWAWGASRILDALEMTPGARIDPTRVGITGCSRYGKGAFMAGALEPRFALTIPQESGVSGSGCWRLAQNMKQNGQNVELASNLASPNTNWLSPNFDRFAQIGVNNLPYDHHMIAGMIAPRGLYIIENLDYLWLGPESDYGCMFTARMIYQALGVSDSMGFSQIGGHAHCAFDSRQQSELTAFVNRFLLNQSTNTTVFRNEGNFAFNTAQWINWNIPSLQ